MYSINTMLSKNADGTYDIIISLYPPCSAEFSRELSTIDGDMPSKKKIRAVKIVVAGLIAVSIPFYSLSNKNQRYAMSYVYFGSHASQLEYIALAKNTLSAVSPSYFDIQSDGSVKVNYISESYIEKVKSMGLKVVPFLSNHWNRAAGVAALENMDVTVDTIVSAINEYNLDGINIDIENVTHTHKDKYTELVRRLRLALPTTKEVSVAVAANPYNWTTGWHGSYDYAALAEYADYLFIMAYDEHYEGGEAGPVASMEFVENSIRYALEECPPEKIVLGIPFFGRIWSENNSSINGLGVSNNRLEQIIADTGGKVTFDEEHMSPKAEFTIKKGESITVSGKTLTAGNYVAWFENDDSIKSKLSLVDKYSLKGAGNWSLGQETKDVWDYYYTWLNGKYFSDILTHFAKDDIQSVSSLGLMLGTGKHTFSPYKSMTRAEMATIAARMLNLTSSTANIPNDAKGHWAEKEIAAVYGAKLMEGYPDGSFKPNNLASREEVAAFLARVTKADLGSGKADFSDVSADRWSYDEIAALTSAGVLLGYPDGTFRPENIIDRGEMAAVLNRISAQ
ncbi:MAG: S-layer homology domain-containing protein [Clostridia bacterium]|nr:S-layer homology domain-containing protein [Clostridia bacterium]